MEHKDHIYTSDEILAAEDLYDIQEQICSFGNSIKYQMTDDEFGWLDFVANKYCIADYIDQQLFKGVLTLNSNLSHYLDLDDCNGKAVCLSDDTALQKLFFWCYQESE